MTDCQNGYTVLVASNKPSLVDNCQEILQLDFTLARASNWSDTVACIHSEQPTLLLLDPQLVSQTPEQTLAGISSQHPSLRIMLITSSESMDLDKIALYKIGVHGFCSHDISPALLKKAVNAVCAGELWMPRNLITQIIETLAQTRGNSSAGSSTTGTVFVDCLTPRELEVAQMVHLGGDNKTIARELAISERTVKAHLSAIFRKLNIENRLHLALFLNDVS